MRWLLICLFVSVVALLSAAAGAARHIWLHRTKRSGEPPPQPGSPLDPAAQPDAEMEP